MRFSLRSLLAAVLALFAAVTLALAATLTASVNTAIIATYIGSNDLGSPRFTLTQALQAPITFASGTGRGQADLIFADRRTLGASGTENIDVSGSLTDPFGSTLTFVTIKGIRICAAADNTNSVVVGGAGSNTLLNVFVDATDKINVKPGGCFIWLAPQTGAAVTAATGDILLIANSSSGSGVTYDITIIGTST